MLSSTLKGDGVASKVYAVENSLPKVLSASELAPVIGNGMAPFSQQTVVFTK
jgi:hypothetical protein